MHVIEFDTKSTESGIGINFFGKVCINGVEKNVVCTVTQEFLQNINKGSIEYMKTFDNNRFTIETIAEDHLNKMPEEELQMETIRIMVCAADVQKYNL